MSEAVYVESVLSENKYPGFSLEAYLKENDITFKPQKADGHVEYSFNCPSCVERGEPRPDIHKRLWVNGTTFQFYCYNCHWCGDISRLVQKISGVDFRGALKVLRGDLIDPMERMNLKLYEEQIDFRDEDELAQIKTVDLPYGCELIKEPHPYLESRGIPHQYVVNNEWSIGITGYCKNRVVVPMYMEDRLVFWQARATWPIEKGDKTQKKVLNPSGVSARHVLFQYDTAKHYDTIILVEGFVDAVKTGPMAVASNGKRLHPQQVEWLRKTKAKEIIIAYDADAWTDERRTRDGELKEKASVYHAADMLKLFFKVRACIIPPGIDFGALPYRGEAIKQFISKSKTL